MAPTFQEIRDRLKQVPISQAETDARFKETDKKFQASEKLLTEKF